MYFSSFVMYYSFNKYCNILSCFFGSFKISMSLLSFCYFLICISFSSNQSFYFLFIDRYLSLSYCFFLPYLFILFGSYSQSKKIPSNQKLWSTFNLIVFLSYTSLQTGLFTPYLSKSSNSEYPYSGGSMQRIFSFSFLVSPSFSF